MTITQYGEQLMGELMNSLPGLIDFAIYFAVSILFLVIFKYIYTFITPHNEWKLIKEESNLAAAVGFGGAMVGYGLALASAVTNSDHLVDFAIWGVVAIIAQVIAFLLLRFTFVPKLGQRIANNEFSAGAMLAAMSVTIGLINAACMTY